MQACPEAEIKQHTVLHSRPHIKQSQSFIVSVQRQSFSATGSSTLHGFLAFILPCEPSVNCVVNFLSKTKTNKQNKELVLGPRVMNFSCENTF